jgi:hypothetical protein
MKSDERPNMRVQRTRSASLRSPLTRGPLGRRSRPVAVAASALLFLACQKEGSTPVQAVVRNPEYLVVRSITREADAEHTTRVEFPYAGAGYGFASTVALLDLNSIELGAVGFAGGRTSVAGEATLWLPLTAGGTQRLEDWSAHHEGDYLGIFLRGKLVAVPRIESKIGRGIPLRVRSKSEGDVVMHELQNGGAVQ